MIMSVLGGVKNIEIDEIFYIWYGYFEVGNSILIP